MRFINPEIICNSEWENVGQYRAGGGVKKDVYLKDCIVSKKKMQQEMLDQWQKPIPRPDMPNTFKFIKPFTTKITVGGFVGRADRTFEKGQSYKGSMKKTGMITLKISPKRATNSTVQETIDVPVDYLECIDCAKIPDLPIPIPKPERPFDEFPQPKNKLDTNQVLLFGMGAIIVILLIKK